MESSYFNNVVNSEYSRKNDGRMEYGTAGFRTKSDILEYVLYRMGLLAVLRSKAKKAAIGLMITASHNLEPDNGIKLVDPAGEMLEASWEMIATNLANVLDSDLTSMLAHISTKENIDLSVPATVIIGRDTRKSSPILLKAALAGIKALNGNVTDLGLVTTPQLHYVVVCTNTDGAYGDPTLQGYYSKLATVFKSIRGTEINNGKYISGLQLDAANGVGAIAAREFQRYLKGVLDIKLFNDGSGNLNYMCGADYIKVQQTLPLNITSEKSVRCVSIDGDADRVVYFYIDGNNKFHLLDGDRIATLVAAYFKELLETSGLSLQLGLVQTAYANGGSTDYISNVLKVPVACVPTGVKHLHKKALEFDIGVYFEANGHGTVIFKGTAKEAIKNHAKNEMLSTIQRVASSKLRDVTDLINETVGDALSDMLLVETILHAKGWDVIEWEKSYNDLPNKQLKVRVKDRNIITTTNAERHCLTPVCLQEEIDKIVLKYSRGRSFVRPSGTEDIVRVYAECESSSDVNKLAVEVASLVYRLAGGVGPEPSLS
ncbi:Phosphoacetylglucosamine mutase [Trachymyrmex septentrionalis]|uniref:Phosphoacetylglucosamine mutase n=1 Tax=Trachymyrmex septentrionalis TaxID=34720 RepID=A0A195FA50_9HYME|nr:PREDICTED: phosphoacetylglucosamine mutase [Trachymyrmex septentrionalis]XP_018345845.1 PREDICTED: phosphoacetylglucosamine mutase [Trachymyrmex septentrionalis]KYN37087.1 Phosphoacetylglucosamine mutase [Trachymyrmex septentrionalis]